MSIPTRHIWSPTLGSSKVVTHESQSLPELKALKVRYESDTDKLTATCTWSIYQGCHMHLPRQHGIQLHSYQWVLRFSMLIKPKISKPVQCLMCDASVMDNSNTS